MAGETNQLEVVKETAREIKEREPKRGEIQLKGDLCEFWLGEGKGSKVQWFVTNLPYKQVRRVLEVQPYDLIKQTGVQRGTIRNHVNKLKSEMLKGEFTPAGWSGSVLDSHLKNLKIDVNKGTVTLIVSERNPLAIIDGGHRYAALEAIRDKADKQLQTALDNLTITVQIYLDPEAVRKNFKNLQAGRPVSKSHMKIMEDIEASKKKGIDPSDKKAFVKELSRQVVWLLNRDEGDDRGPEFISGDVNFTTVGEKHMEYASITTTGGSDIATSVAGGARVTQYYRSLFPGGIDEQRDFLVACYKAIWEGIEHHAPKAEQVDATDGKRIIYPAIVGPGMTLRPNKKKGTKGGTGLLLMLGNMLAFRALAVRREPKIVATDVKKLVDSAVATLHGPVSGGNSGPIKRQLTGEFVREFFEDVVQQDDENDVRKMEAIDGIPRLLCDEILTRSTLGLDRNSGLKDERPRRLSDPDQTSAGWNNDEEEEVPETELELELGDMEDEELSNKRGRKPRSNPPEGVMG